MRLELSESRNMRLSRHTNPSENFDFYSESKGNSCAGVELRGIMELNSGLAVCPGVVAREAARVRSHCSAQSGQWKGGFLEQEDLLLGSGGEN